MTLSAVRGRQRPQISPTLSKLPEEQVINISSFLPLKDNLRLAATNKNFHARAQKIHSISTALQAETGHVAQFFCKLLVTQEDQYKNLYTQIKTEISEIQRIPFERFLDFVSKNLKNFANLYPNETHSNYNQLVLHQKITDFREPILIKLKTIPLEKLEELSIATGEMPTPTLFKKIFDLAKIYQQLDDPNSLDALEFEAAANKLIENKDLVKLVHFIRSPSVHRLSAIGFIFKELKERNYLQGMDYLLNTKPFNAEELSLALSSYFDLLFKNQKTKHIIALYNRLNETNELENLTIKIEKKTY